MGFLTKAQILAVEDIPTQEVDVPEWGGKVMVRGLTAGQRGRFTETIVDQRGKKNVIRLQDIQIRLCMMTIVDPISSKRLFEEADMKALGEKSGAALERVSKAAQVLSGLSDEDVEELTKNSEAIQSEDSLLD